MARAADVDAGNSLIAAVGTAFGVALSRGFDYLKFRRREAGGDRRDIGKEWNRLIGRLEKRLDATEIQAKRALEDARLAASRLAECERGHVECRTELRMMRQAVNEIRVAADMPPLPEQA